jgi:hypothetical protein
MQRGRAFLALAVLLASSWTVAQTPVGTAFSYQGRLTDAGTPANGVYDLRFILYDADIGGSQVGPVVTKEDLTVAGGLFTVSLDFGAAFDGNKRFLEIAVRPGASTGSFMPLAARQELTPTPNAIASQTAPWSGLTGVPAGFADGVDDNSGGTVTSVGTGYGLTGGPITSSGGIAVDNTVIQQRVTGTCSVGSSIRIIAPSGGVTCEPDDNSGGTVTSVATGTGLAGGPITSTGTISVSFGTTGTTVASGDHNHFGQSWSGSGNGLVVNSGASDGIRGLASAGTGTHYGVDGQAASAAGAGVRGWATATTGATFGVYGLTSSSTDDSRGVFGYAPAPTGGTNGVYGQSDSTTGRGVLGLAPSTSGSNTGVYGATYSTTGRGVLGLASMTTGANYGVAGQTYSSQGRGVAGLATAASGVNYGVYGQTDSSDGRGVYGVATAPSGVGYGVYGETQTTDSSLPPPSAVYGLASSTSGTAAGVFGETHSSAGRALLGYATATSGLNYGVFGYSDSTTGEGVYGLARASSGTNYGIHGWTNSPDGYAGYFHGPVYVSGYLSKAGGGFKIDHPLDPEHKYLNHSFVESPDMKNVYDGVVTTDASGYAAVELPDWFEALNRDFRYQLTVVDESDLDVFVQVKVVHRIADNRFTIRSSAPGTEISWQVTGIRKDAWAEAHRIPVERDKTGEEQNTYLHPEVFGQPKEMSSDYKRHPLDRDRPGREARPPQP